MRLRPRVDRRTRREAGLTPRPPTEGVHPRALRARRQDGHVRADRAWPSAGRRDGPRGSPSMTPPLELPVIHAGPTATPPTAEEPRQPVATISHERYEQLAGRVKLLSWLSL